MFTGRLEHLSDKSARRPVRHRYQSAGAAYARRGYRFVADVYEMLPDNVSVNGAAPFAAQATETGIRRFKRFLFPAMGASVLLIGAAIAGTWFVRSRNFDVAPVLSAPFASEKLSTDGRVFAAAISPDGKTVVYTNQNTGKESVWLRQLEYNNNIEIIPPSDDSYYEFVFSPDAAFLYFSRRTKGVETHSDIYRISIFGGIPVKVVSETQGWLSLSPDGGTLSYVRCYYRDDEYCSLWVADAGNGKNERKLVTHARDRTGLRTMKSRRTERQLPSQSGNREMRQTNSAWPTLTSKAAPNVS